MNLLSTILLGFLMTTGDAVPQVTELNPAQASHLASLALGCIGKEFPNKLDHVMNDAGEVKSPRVLHPAFYGCFDWHSSVHGHWMLVRLLRQFPALPESAQIRAALDANLSAGNLKAEAAYLEQPNRQSFERTYGWAWLFKLSEELSGWKDPDAQKWSRNLQPLTLALRSRLLTFLPKQTYPIRTGVHPNTAFALAFAWDLARPAGTRNWLRSSASAAVPISARTRTIRQPGNREGKTSSPPP